MKKYLVHIEEIQQRGAKVQFQIKLPSTSKKVCRLGMTIDPRIVPSLPIPSASPQLVGSAWLRVADKRDVFYADSLYYSDSKVFDYSTIPVTGISAKGDWWFAGTKRSLFSVDVLTENGFIEGYYEDQSFLGAVDYQLKVYLELEMKHS